MTRRFSRTRAFAGSGVLALALTACVSSSSPDPTGRHAPAVGQNLATGQDEPAESGSRALPPPPRPTPSTSPTSAPEPLPDPSPETREGAAAEVSGRAEFREPAERPERPEPATSEPSQSASPPQETPAEAPTTRPEPEPSVDDRTVPALEPVNVTDAGLTDPSGLVPHDGGTFDEDGGVLENVTVDGDLTLSGQNQTLRNVRITGKLQLRYADGATVEHAELGTMSISASTGVVVRSVDIVGSRGEDGIHVTSGRATVKDLLIEGSRIHSPQLTASSHYDGIQVRGVDGLTLRNNSFELGPWKKQFTASIFLEDANGGNRDVLIEHNYIDGGGYALYLSGQDVRVIDNIFGPNARWGLVFPNDDESPVTSGNVDVEGKPVL